MLRRPWLWPLRFLRRPSLSLPSAVGPSVSGDPLDALLEASVAMLAAQSGADRAGVWVESTPADPYWTGKTAGIGASNATTSTRLKASQIFFGELAAFRRALELRAPSFPSDPPGFFDGMRSAVALPLGVRGQCFGVAIVASRARWRLAPRKILEALASEIALSCFTEMVRDHWVRTQQTLQLRQEIDLAIADGLSVGNVLDRMAVAVARDTHAGFAGFARRTGAKLSWQALAGSKSLAMTAEDALLRVTSGAPPSAEPVVQDFSHGPVQSLSLVQLCLNKEREDSLLLLAGYRCGESIPLETLRGFRAMAAMAILAIEAREIESAYRSLFESGAEALLVTDASGIIVEQSRRARELLRWKKALSPHLPLAQCFVRPSPQEVEQWLTQAAAGRPLPPLEGDFANGLSVRIAIRKALTGERRLVLALEEGSLVRRAERQQRQLEAELRGVLDAIHSGVLVVAPGGHIRFASARFGMLFGLEARTLATLKTMDDLARLLEPRFRSSESFLAPWKSFISGSGEALHDELELAGPARRVFERFARPILDADGHCLGWLEIYSDITDQRQIQFKLLQTEKMAAVGQLVSGIAHELNNPLTSIMGYAQLALGRQVSETPNAEVKMIFQEAERARRIVKNLLYFARQTQPERSRVDLNEIVDRTIALRGYELKIENISIHCLLDPDLPPTLADPYQLQQVVLNLLVNAEQAILENRGCGHIEVRTRKASGSRLAVEVADDGPGIPPEIASRIFDPFFTTKPPGVGTGLGLSIVYGIVEQHGGEVSFENLPESGAKFTVELPIVAVPTHPVAAAAPSGDSVATVSAGRILVVEDEPTVARLIADVLGEEGHQVEAVFDSQEGLARVARSHYDLIICDLRMPRLDGPAFYDSLVRTGSSARHRILFITGDTLGPHTVEFLKSRQLPFLAKPFLVEELKLAANRVLAGSGDSLTMAGTEARS